jgi:polar amino acid transport system permease protein
VPMNYRKHVTGVALLAALLALAVTALTPVALGQETPSPSPSTTAAAEGTPVVVGTIPNPEAVVGSATADLWSGDAVQVNYEPNGSVLDAPKCAIYINDELQELTGDPNVQYLSPATPTLNFSLKEKYSSGDYDFKAVLVTEEGATVEYSWSFSSQGEAGSGGLVSFKVMRDWFWFIARGAIVTVELTVISIVFACIFALFGALGRLSRTMSYKQAWDRYRSWGYMARMTLGRFPYWIATFYTSLFRGTPLLLQIIAIYQVIPEIIKNLGFGDATPPGFMQTLGWGDNYNIPAFYAGVIALSLNYGAYLTEVFRAGIQAVPKGQNEAAWAIGLSGWQTQRRIVLPQAFKIVIPAVGNDFIALIKDTSLVSVITVEELLRRSQLAGAATFSFMSTLLVAAAFYWALTIFFSFWQAKLETRMARDKAREKERR